MNMRMIAPSLLASAFLALIACSATSSSSLRGIALPVNGNKPLIIRHEAETIAMSANSTTVGDETFYISVHDFKTGKIEKLVDSPLTYHDDSSGTPGCNAALDSKRKVYYKTAIKTITYIPGDCPSGCGSKGTCCKDPTAVGDQGSCFSVPCGSIPTGAGLGGGDLLTIDIETCVVLRNKTMTGTPHHPPSLAYSEATGLSYGVIPYSYTEYGIFSYDAESGEVSQLNTMKKGTMDGIGNCIGGVLEWNNRTVLWYQLSQGHTHTMVFVDLHTLQEVQRVPGFFITVKDPNAPHSLLGLLNTEPGVRLVRLSPATNRTTTLFSMNATSLGSDLRAQDQASLAINDQGSRVWFAASYNTPSGELDRGVFTLELHSDSATLLSEAKLFGQPDQKTTVIGRLDWV